MNKDRQFLELQPLTLREARAFVGLYHRHHIPPQGGKFAIAVNDGEKIVGVIIVGRPVSRYLDQQGFTAEVTRCCTDGTKNAASALYGAAWRAAKGMGNRRLITYTLQAEPGTSLLAAGYKNVGLAGGGTWNSKTRLRVDKHPLEQKQLWEVTDSEDYDAHIDSLVKAGQKLSVYASTFTRDDLDQNNNQETITMFD